MQSGNVIRTYLADWISQPISNSQKKAIKLLQTEKIISTKRRNIYVNIYNVHNFKFPKITNIYSWYWCISMTSDDGVKTRNES